jgi:hypothetical protein
MVKRGLLTAAVLGTLATSGAGSLEELKNLLNQKEVNVGIALTGDYIYTSDRSDKIGGLSGYEDTFGYNAYLELSKEATENSPFGFKVSVSNDDWAPVVGVEPLPDSSNRLTVDEAYAEALLGNLYLQAGRLLTNIGGEAPYTFQNINIQRGLVWNGEPVFYNGVRIGGEFQSVGFYLGVNDRDTSDGKMALEGGISLNLPAQSSASFNILLPDKNDENPTKVYNLTFNTAVAGLPVTLYADYLSTPQPGDDADSVGVAALTELSVNEQISVGTRVEYVHNDGDGDNYGIGTGNYAWTFTLTPKYQFNKYLYIRAEASYVKLGHKYYQKSDNPNDLTDNQFRLGAEVGFVF